MEVRTVVSTGAVTVLAVTFLSMLTYWSWRKKVWSKRVFPQRYKKVATVAKVIIYPIKGLPGIEVESGICEAAGLRCGKIRDRMWMIITGKGKTVDLKAEPTLALLTPSLHGDQVWVDGPDMSTLKLDIISSASSGNFEVFKLYTDNVKAIRCKQDATDWFRKYLGKSDVKLVQHVLSFPSKHISSKAETEPPRSLGQAMAFQYYSTYHLLSLPSIEFLNRQLEEPVTYRRFRPNFLVDGCKSHEEDGWETVKFNDSAVLYFQRTCTRCNVTTVNPDTGKKNNDYEPVSTLRKYRLASEPDKRSKCGIFPFFGVNLGLVVEGIVSVGDDVFAGVGA